MDSDRLVTPVCHSPVSETAPGTSSTSTGTSSTSTDTRRRTGVASDTPSDREQIPSDREQIAKRLFDAFNRRDLAGALALVHPEIVFQPVSAAVMTEGRPYCGHEGISRYLSDVETHWMELTVHPVHVRAAGRAVVALGQVTGRGPMGELDQVPTTWVLKFRDGLVVHAQIFSDERHVREALGEESEPP